MRREPRRESLLSESDASDENTDREDSDLSEEQIALYNLCHAGRREDVVTLLDRGVDPNFFLRGEAPIHVAAKVNACGIIAALLVCFDEGNGTSRSGRKLARADVRDLAYGWTPLHYAVSLGHLEATSMFCFLRRDLLHYPDRQGRSPLQLSIENVQNAKQRSFTMLFPYLPLKCKDIAKIISDFSSDQPNGNGCITHNKVGDVEGILLQIKFLLGDLFGKNGKHDPSIPPSSTLLSYVKPPVYMGNPIYLHHHHH